jgi:hypothetical protein
MKPQDQSRRLVLVSGFANGGLQAAVADAGWEYLYTYPPGRAEALEYVWRIDPEHTFHYFECTNYPLEYCMVVGSRPEEVLAQVSSRLDFLDADELASAFDRAATVDERALMTFALGIAADDAPQSTIAERIRSSFRADQPPVRLAAIDAAFVTGWETFLDELKRLSASDPDPLVNETAANAVAEWAARSTSEPETR